MSLDYKLSLGDKKFVGFDAQAYLRDEVGFTDNEAVRFLIANGRRRAGSA